jgi:hypothetical protein
MKKISELTFRKALYAKLEPLRGKVHSVTGPGRSGAIAAVYVSHYLGIPFIPFYRGTFDRKLVPVLIVDTATNTGKTLRRAERKVKAACVVVSVYREPPIVRFWYERFHKGFGYAVKIPKRDDD